MSIRKLKSLAVFSILTIGLASAAQAEGGGGGGGGNDRLSELTAQSTHLNRSRDGARSTARGNSTQSMAAEQGYRDVTVTRGGRSTSHRAGGPAERTASAEWKDEKGNVVRWNPPKRVRQGDFAESRERGTTIRSDENPFGGREVTTTRGGRSQTQPSIYDNKSWIR